jgi:glutathione peroxidase
MGLMGCGTGVQSDDASPLANASGTHSSLDPNHPKNTIYSYKLKDIDGWPIALSRYEGKVLLVVNVASECRFTDQYRNLQRLYMTYKNRGFVVLGFPSNEFGRQERGTNAEIKEFTKSQFNIMFPLFSKIAVEGDDMHPLYQCLTSPDVSGEFSGPITWNFTKFLIDRNGKTVARFDPAVDPLAPQVTSAIEAALQ